VDKLFAADRADGMQSSNEGCRHGSAAAPDGVTHTVRAWNEEKRHYKFQERPAAPDVTLTEGAINICRNELNRLLPVFKNDNDKLCNQALAAFRRAKENAALKTDLAEMDAENTRLLGERVGFVKRVEELEGEILEDIPGALWNRSTLDECRIKEAPADLERVLVAVDPAASSSEGADENGIVVVGLARDEDGYARGYVLEDASLRGTPEEWARKAVQMYRKWSADKIVAEKNNGGEMVSSVIKAADRSVPVKLVHASRGKIVRAEPISALYEQNRIHHVGRFDQLEDQMCTFSIDNIRNSSTGSPDRVDALVWGLSEIFEKIAGRRRTTKTDASSSSGATTSWSIDAHYNNTPNGWMAG